MFWGKKTLLQYLVVLFRATQLPIPRYTARGPACTLSSGANHHTLLISHQLPGCTSLIVSPQFLLDLQPQCFPDDLYPKANCLQDTCSPAHSADSPRQRACPCPHGLDYSVECGSGGFRGPQNCLVGENGVGESRWHWASETRNSRPSSKS